MRVMRVIRDVEDGQHGQIIHLVRQRPIVVMILKAIVQFLTVLHNNISGEYSRTTTIHYRIAKFYDHPKDTAPLSPLLSPLPPSPHRHPSKYQAYQATNLSQHLASITRIPHSSLATACRSTLASFETNVVST